MSNPLLKSQLTSRIEHAIARFRKSLTPRQPGTEGERAKPAWIIYVFAALLIGGVSLATLARERSSKNDAAEPTASTATARSEAAPAKAAESHPSRSGSKKSPGAESEKNAEKEPAAEKTRGGEKEEQAGASQEATSLQVKPVAGVGEVEDANLVRARQDWFYKQRAYPLDHIPQGMRQKAQDHLDRMIVAHQASQLGASALQYLAPKISGAPGPQVITFPGPNTWTPIGPAPSASFQFGSVSGRVTAIAVDPTNSNIVYVGGAQGGVWKTINGGTTWTPLTDSQVSLAIGAIGIDPNSCSPSPCSTIYAGTGEDNFSGDSYYGAGILKSTNGGTTWTQLGAANFAGPFSSGTGGARIGAIAVQPGNSSIVLAAVDFFDGNDPNGGVWRSTDGGTTWGRPTGATGAAGTDIVFESSGTNAWAALGDIFGATNNGIWRSTDSGATWTKQTAAVLPSTNIGRIQLGYAPGTIGTSAVVYAAIADSSVSSTTLLGTFKTITGGASWTSFTINAGGVVGNFCSQQCWYDMILRVDPANSKHVFVGGSAFNGNQTNLFRSLDGGGTWTDVTAVGDGTFIHPDQHAMAFDSAGTVLYDGNDGGVWKSTTFTAATPTWTDLNGGGLSNIQFYPGNAVDPSNENDGLGGSQDNGTIQFSGNPTWNQIGCGDGGPSGFDKNTPTNVFISCTIFNQPYLQKSVTGDQSFLNFFAIISGIDPADFGRTPFIPASAIDRNNPTILYTGTYRVYQTTNGALNWTAISPDLSANGASGISAISVSQADDTVVYAATQDGQVWRTTNANAGTGAIWTNLTKAPLPPRAITSIATDSADPNTVFVTFSGFSGFVDTVGHVFRSTDGGNTWTDVSCHNAGACQSPLVNDLANLPVNFAAFDDRNNIIYVGSDIGVFSSSDGGNTWAPVGSGLPRVAALGADVGRRSGIVHVSTHGRGEWIFQLPGFIPGAGPFLTSLNPGFVSAGSGATVVTVDGANFTASSVVQADGATNGIITTFVSVNQLTALLPARML